MKRDFELIRIILSDIANQPAEEPYTSIENIKGYDPATIYGHIELLIDAGLINGKVVRVISVPKMVNINDLTWKGHDFLDATKDETIWNKAKESVLKPTASMTYSVLLSWLEKKAKETLGFA